MMNVGYYFIRGINKIFKLNAIKNSKIHPKAKLCYKIQMVNSSIGKYSYIGENGSILYTDIGAFCSIAENCTIGGPSHSMEYVSTSPIFTKGRNIFGKNFAEINFDPYRRTIIGNDVWIGSMCMIKAGIQVGNGAVIGMGSVVTRDVPDYEIWAGNPARCIRKRFDDKTIEKLRKIKWWEYNDTELRIFGKEFDDPQSLISKLER